MKCACPIVLLLCPPKCNANGMASNEAVEAGHYCKFIAEPSEALRCIICFGVAKEPVQHEACGRLFCKSCVERLGGGQPCPYCRRKQPNYFSDSKSKVNIIAIKQVKIQVWLDSVNSGFLPAYQIKIVHLRLCAR